MSNGEGEPPIGLLRYYRNRREALREQYKYHGPKNDIVEELEWVNEKIKELENGEKP